MKYGHYKMKKRILNFFVASSVSTSLAFSQGYVTPKEGWYSFDPAMAKKPGGVHLGEFLGNAPVVSYLRANGERFEAENKPGIPVRLWGINLTSKAPEPITLDFIKETKTIPFLVSNEAVRAADLLAANGMNIVRLHHMAYRFIAMQEKLGSPSASAEEKKASHEAWNRFDFFLSLLKERGIRANYNFLTDGWNVPENSDAPPLPKVNPGTRIVYLYHPALIKLQKDRITAFLEHVNPYEGLAYKNDPVISVVELINETSFYGSGETGEKSDLPEEYAKELDRQFNDWLRKKYRTTAAIQKAWGDLENGESLEAGNVKRKMAKNATDPRSQSVALFYSEVETEYVHTMTDHLRRLGYKGLIGGNNNWYGVAGMRSQFACDFTDIHGYKSHPNFTGGKWDPLSFTIQNYPAVDAPEGLAKAYSAYWPNGLPMHKWTLGNTVGRPAVSSEWNWAFPGETLSEGPALVAAYAAFQDMAGLYLFMGDNWLQTRPINFFDLHPSFRAQLPAAAIAYLRGDVAVAKKTVEIPFTHQEAAESTAKYMKAFSHGKDLGEKKGVSVALALIHRVRNLWTTESKSMEEPEVPSSPYVSDTAELRWEAADQKDGLVTVDAPRYQVFAGHPVGRSPATRALRWLNGKNFGVISAVSLSSEAIDTSGKILLVVSGKMEYAGQTWKDSKKNALLSYGEGPAGLFEPVEGELAVASTKKLKAFALDQNGDRASEIPLRVSGKEQILSLKGLKSPWVHLVSE